MAPLALIVVFLLLISSAVGNPAGAPAMFIFGDSVVDAGNNNYIPTLIKANFLPYGRDFRGNKPTGRFCNGRIATDFIAETIGFESYQVPYLSDEARGQNLLIGANFASASSGYYEPTASLNLAISLPKQLDFYKEYQAKVIGMVGEANASNIFSRGLYIINAGSSDFVQNYYVNPLLQMTYTAEQFSDLLLQSYSTFVQNLYQMGARKIGVTTLPPIGCLPASITLFGLGDNHCVERLNYNAIAFNRRLNSTSQNLQNMLSGLRLVVFDIYQPLYDLVTSPNQHGFYEARRGCCGTGFLETSILCNSLSIGTCSNASEYVFWDGFHPSEAANEIIAQTLSGPGFSLIYGLD